MFIIDVQNKIPIFEQLKKQILEFITIGILKPNDKLPSVRSLASELGVNPNTVSKAYVELEAQGYIYTEKGKGCFVADNEAEKQIKEVKLNEFEHIVKDMKKHHIEKEKLLAVVNGLYKEGNIDDSTK